MGSGLGGDAAGAGGIPAAPHGGTRCSVGKNLYVFLFRQYRKVKHFSSARCERQPGPAELLGSCGRRSRGPEHGKGEMGKSPRLSRMDSQKRQNRLLSSHGDLGKVKSRGSSFTDLFVQEHLHTCKISLISLLRAVIPFGELWTDVALPAVA